MRNLNQKQLLLIGVMVLVALIRILMPKSELLGSFATFTPLGAMALYGGAYFSGYKKFLFPLLTLWISDIFLNRYLYFGEWVFFYGGFLWTYGAFAMMAIVGKLLLKRINIINFIASAFIITFIHWIVTDLGVFLGGTMYPMTWAGWWACLVAAIPFEKNILIGTLFYGAIMFGSFEWLLYRSPSLRKV